MKSEFLKDGATKDLVSLCVCWNETYAGIWRQIRDQLVGFKAWNVRKNQNLIVHHGCGNKRSGGSGSCWQGE